MRSKYELHCECVRSRHAEIDDPSHPWYCWKLVKPDYEAAREAAHELLAFIYSGAILSQPRYEEILNEGLRRIVDAAWDGAVQVIEEDEFEIGKKDK